MRSGIRGFATPLILSLLLQWNCSAPATRNPAGRVENSGQRSSLQEHVDGIGRTVTLPAQPRRIISLAPSVTEVLYLLGAGDRIVGVTTHCDWPEEARSKPKTGSLLNPNYELILAAQPDLVIASTAGNDRGAVLRLIELGIPVYVTAPRSVEGIFETVAAIAALTGDRARGDEIRAGMRARLNHIQRRLSAAPPVRALFITWFDPLLAPGRNTFENDVLRHANIVSLSSGIEEFYPRFSLETLLAKDPDAIISVAHPGNPLPDLTRLKGWQRLTAVKSGKVYIADPALQHPSPRFVEALEQLAHMLYPERFP